LLREVGFPKVPQIRVQENYNTIVLIILYYHYSLLQYYYTTITIFEKVHPSAQLEGAVTWVEWGGSTIKTSLTPFTGPMGKGAYRTIRGDGALVVGRPYFLHLRGEMNGGKRRKMRKILQCK